MNERMYTERKGNVPVFRGCGFGCTYCAFKRLVQMNKKCPDCATFTPHFHPEALNKTPPKTKPGEFLTIGLSGDVSFMPWNELEQVLNYCHKWNDRTFLIQSKNPAVFTKHFINCDNVIIGTTIETDAGFFWKPKSEKPEIITYNEISKAPMTRLRASAMAELQCRKAVTIEPILEFSGGLMDWILKIKPEVVWLGYDSGNNKLPEPKLEHTQNFISELLGNGVDIRLKLMREAWWEEA